MAHRYDTTKKCQVCCGPRRIPTRLEVYSLEGAVELAQEVVNQEKVTISGPPGTVEKVERLIAAAKLLGAQEARKELI